MLLHFDEAFTHPLVGRPNGAGRKYCDNAGCTKRRVITARTSNDGITWTNPQGCIPHPGVKCWLPGQDPALDQCCAAYNETEIISPNQYDPPELQVDDSLYYLHAAIIYLF